MGLELDEDDVRPPAVFTSEEVEALARAIHGGEAAMRRARQESFWSWEEGCADSERWPGSMPDKVRQQAIDEARAALAAYSSMGHGYVVFLRMTLATPGLTEYQRACIRPVVAALEKR